MLTAVDQEQMFGPTTVTTIFAIRSGSSSHDHNSISCGLHTNISGQCLNAFYHQLFYPCAACADIHENNMSVHSEPLLERRRRNRRLFLLPQDPIYVLCINIFCPSLIIFRIEQRFGEEMRKGMGKKSINTHL